MPPFGPEALDQLIRDVIDQPPCALRRLLLPVKDKNPFQPHRLQVAKDTLMPKMS